MAMELVRENIECEQLLGENFSDTVVKAEYIIPDTHPDVCEILMLDAKPCVVNKEVMQDKVYLEGQIEYNILYLAKEEEEDKYGVYNLTYTAKFSNYVDVHGAMHKMLCEADCNVEHMEKMILNERKIAIEGIIKLKCEVYKKYDFQVVKDVIGVADMQLLKNPSTVDKMAGNIGENLIAKSHMQIPMDKPQIGNVIKCDVNIHKKDVRVMEGKMQITAFAKVQLLYRGKDTRDLCTLEDDVFISKEVEVDGIDSSMACTSDLRVDAVEIDIKEDDLGENRIADVEALVKADTKVMYKEEMDMIEDAYSPNTVLQMEKKDYELNVMQGQASNESIVKGNIDLNSEQPKPAEIIMCSAKASVTDKKIVEDKVLIDGLMEVEVLYRADDDKKLLYTVKEEMPFTCNAEIPGAKIDMQCVAKVSMESVEASVEANTIAVKAVVQSYARVNYVTHKEFLVDMVPLEEEAPKKKASITIYVVQAGDTLWKIAKNYFTTMDTLIKINDIDENQNVKVGQKLIIPGRAVI